LQALAAAIDLASNPLVGRASATTMKRATREERESFMMMLVAKLVESNILFLLFACCLLSFVVGLYENKQ